jgi:hypothetical protein
MYEETRFRALFKRIVEDGEWWQDVAGELSTSEWLLIALSLHKTEPEDLLDRTPEEAWARLDDRQRETVMMLRAELEERIQRALAQTQVTVVRLP